MVSRLSSMGRWFIDIKSPGDVVEKVAYIAAIVLFSGLLIGVGNILGPAGVVTLIGTALFIWIIKWGWIWFLK